MSDLKIKDLRARAQVRYHMGKGSAGCALYFSTMLRCALEVNAQYIIVTPSLKKRIKDYPSPQMTFIRGFDGLVKPFLSAMDNSYKCRVMSNGKLRETETIQADKYIKATGGCTQSLFAIGPHEIGWIDGIVDAALIA